MNFLSGLFAGLGSIQWLSPLALWGLATLPLLWWLLRLTPPAPKRIIFPALFLLRGLAATVQSPAHTPWWLLLLRLALLCSLFLGLARPVLAPTTKLSGSGALVILVDNGWAAGAQWSQWQAAINSLCQQAEREQRDISVIPTAPEQRSGHLIAMGPAPALTTCPSVAKLQPHPWPVDHQAAQKLLNDKNIAQNYVYWFSDGLQGTGTEKLFAQLQTSNNLTLYQDERAHYLLQPALHTTSSGLSVTITRAETSKAADILLTAQDKTNKTLSITQASFKPREKNLTLNLDLPNTLHNQAVRLVLQDSPNAGTVWLLDSSHARHNVGLIGDEVSQHAQPLLNGLHYLERALNDRHDVSIGTVENLLTHKVAIILNTNERAILPANITLLEAWVQQGGVLVQFSGAELAPDSPLIPTPLRQNRRDLGGIFSWGKPQPLQAFPAHTPFSGLAISPEITISQQLLADPAALNGDSSWALLEDGTPLVTGRRSGKGLVVLFHVPANPGWSNLPLSGLFVQMLNRLVALGATGSIAAEGAATLPPLTVLDGFGQLQSADSSTSALTPDEQKNYQASPEHPPGYYGQTKLNRAFNLGQGLATLLPFAPDTHETLSVHDGQIELRPWLLTFALLLFFADMLIALLLRGLLFPRTLLAIMFLSVLSNTSFAETTEATAQSEKIWLGYITNGASGRSTMAGQALTALADRVKQKTAVDLIGTLPINLEQDDLSLIPFLYWPLSENPQLSSKAQQKLQDYFSYGGMVLIDLPSDPENNQTLRSAGIPLPMLAPLTDNHPLLRTFYLLHDCPGHNDDGTLWSERDVSGRQDNVPALFIGSRDWASAWLEGKHGSTRQQEMAMRCGVNMVMYALTGNYKMDQLHVSAILERLNR